MPLAARRHDRGRHRRGRRPGAGGAGRRGLRRSRGSRRRGAGGWSRSGSRCRAGRTPRPPRAWSTAPASPARRRPGRQHQTKSISRIFARASARLSPSWRTTPTSSRRRFISLLEGAARLHRPRPGDLVAEDGELHLEALGAQGLGPVEELADAPVGRDLAGIADADTPRGAADAGRGARSGRSSAIGGGSSKAGEILPRHLADQRRDAVRLHQDPAGVGGDDGKLAGPLLGDADALRADLVEVGQVGVGTSVEPAVGQEPAAASVPRTKTAVRPGQAASSRRAASTASSRSKCARGMPEVVRLEDGDALAVLDVRDDHVRGDVPPREEDDPAMPRQERGHGREPDRRAVDHVQVDIGIEQDLRPGNVVPGGQRLDLRRRRRSARGLGGGTSGPRDPAPAQQRRRKLRSAHERLPEPEGAGAPERLDLLLQGGRPADLRPERGDRRAGLGEAGRASAPLVLRRGECRGQSGNLRIEPSLSRARRTSCHPLACSPAAPRPVRRPAPPGGEPAPRRPRAEPRSGPRQWLRHTAPSLRAGRRSGRSSDRR